MTGRSVRPSVKKTDSARSKDGIRQSNMLMAGQKKSEEDCREKMMKGEIATCMM